MKRIAAMLIICALFTHGKVHAQSASLIADNNDVEMNFPTSILFKADLSSSTIIEKVKLHYGTTQDTCGIVSAIAFPEITPGTSVSAQWEWDMRQSGGEPPGATIWWQWEVIDSQGSSQFSERNEIIWIDDIHPWTLLEEGMIRLHYYYPDKAYGETLKEAAVAALDRLAQDIGMTPEQPIDLYIYASTEDMADAVFYEPGWTGGLAYSDYNILIIGIEPYNLEWGTSTEAHEMTHILEGDYTFSCLGATPTWLSEGLAVYGEGGPRADWISMFEENKNDDTLLSFKVLSGGFSEDPAVADLSYSQSYYMVNYLIENYGKEKMLEFLSAIKSGGELNESLQAVYGFDLTGFENEWRASLGLAAIEAGTTQSTIVPTIIPTIMPIQGAESQGYATPSSPMSTPTVSTTSTDSTLVDDTPVPPQHSSLPPISSGLRKWLPLILLLIAASCILLVIILLVIRRKGERK